MANKSLYVPPQPDRPVPDVSGRDLRRSDLNTGLTPERSDRVTDTDDLLLAVRRILRALSRRVGESDTEALRALADLRREVDQTVTDAVAGLRNDPVAPASWAEIGEAFGITAQGAQQRYGHVGGRRRPGGQRADWR